VILRLWGQDFGLVVGFAGLGFWCFSDHGGVGCGGGVGVGVL
jgi:hypothetical protein